MSGGEAAPGDVRGQAVLVTGATGKVGRRLVGALVAEAARVSILTRDPSRAKTLWPGAPVDCRRGDLTAPETLAGLLDGIDRVFHLASYSPAPHEPDIYEAAPHWPVTALGTANLASLVAASGVRGLVYLSSVKAMGDAAGALGRPADERDPARPDSLYGRAKLAAEREVLALGERGIRAGVLRLPMVYGLPGQGNLARMVDAVARGRFPPWPRVANRRSAIHVDDAVRAALLVAQHPGADGQVFLVTDGRAYSTRWMYERVRAGLGFPAPRRGVPLWALAAAAAAGSLLEKATGRAMPLTRSGLSKLTGDAWYSSEKIRAKLGFAPRHDLEREIPLLVRQYREAKGRPRQSAEA